MNGHKLQIAMLLAVLVLIVAATAVLHRPEGGAVTIRMAGQVGLVTELLESTAGYLAGTQNRCLEVRGGQSLDFLRNSDCCAAATTWGLGAGSLHGAVMCPDAAAEFLVENPDFVSFGPIMLNSDVIMLSVPDGAVRKVGLSHKRSHQLLMARAVFSKAEYVPMLPVGLPYALKKGEVEAIIIDLGVASGLEGEYRSWKGEALPTQILVLHRDFAQSEAFADFALAYERARQDLLEKYAGSGLALPELGNAF